VSTGAGLILAANSYCIGKLCLAPWAAVKMPSLSSPNTIHTMMDYPLTLTALLERAGGRR